MCGIFGFKTFSEKGIGFGNVLTKRLAINSSVRGTDATGYSYPTKEGVVIQKAPVPAWELEYLVPKDARTVLGHTRATTQGNAYKNQNNHPFIGKLANGEQFSFAHNGVLTNDRELQLDLPKTSIETDSYVAAQLLTQKGELNIPALKEIGESVEGMFIFTYMTNSGDIAFVRKDNPISMMYFESYEMLVYASTEEILLDTVMEVPELRDEVLYMIDSGERLVRFIDIFEKEIVLIDNDGVITKDTFKPVERVYVPTSVYRTTQGMGGGSKSNYFHNYNNAYIDRGSNYPPKMVDSSGMCGEDILSTLIDNPPSKEELEEFQAFSKADPFRDYQVRDLMYFGINKEVAEYHVGMNDEDTIECVIQSLYDSFDWNYMY